MIGELSFGGLVVVAAIAFLAPILVALPRRLAVPAVVAEIVAGIAVGPAGLGLVAVDAPIAVLSLVGLAFLLFLAGLEFDLARLLGPRLRLAVIGFAVTLAIGGLAGLGLVALGIGSSPWLLAIILASTSLGIVIPVLRDSGEASSELGQLVLAGSTIADVAGVLLLTLLFSESGASPAATAILLALFVALVAAAALAIAGVERTGRASALLVRLQDTTAQIRVRGAVLVLVAFVALAETLGLEILLGAFLAGATIALLDRDRAMTHPRFREKLDAAGFGVFIPVFFVASGLRFDLGALLASPAALTAVPACLLALVAVRGLPALLYRRRLDRRRIAAAGFLQATSLPFIVAASQIGIELGLLDPSGSAALIAAGLLSVLIFPAAAVSFLRSADTVPPTHVPVPRPATGGTR